MYIQILPFFDFLFRLQTQAKIIKTLSSRSKIPTPAATSKINPSPSTGKSIGSFPVAKSRKEKNIVK